MREEILNTATEMFLNLGFKSVTMDDIAESMGISKKTIYANFKTKEKLVESCSFQLFESVSNGIDEIIAEKHNPIEELLLIHQFILKRLRKEKTSPQFQLSKYYSKIDRCIRTKKMERMSKCVVENLHRGIEQGLYRKEINVDITFRFYFMTLEGIKNTEYFPAENYPVTVLVRHFLEYYLRGIASPKGAEVLKTLEKKFHNEL